MAASTTSESKNTIGIKARRFFTLLSFILLSFSAVLGQAPTWVAGTPSVVSTGALSVTLNYGINEVGTIYIAIYNFNNPALYPPATVKAITSVVPPSGSYVARGIIAVTAGNINTVLQTVINLPTSSNFYTIYIVAEGFPGGYRQQL